MSRGNRGKILAAFVGIAALAGLVGLYAGAVLTGSQGQQQEAITGNKAGSHKGQHPQQSDTDHAGVPGPVERLLSNPEPRETDERENRDLAAQENTAAWAFWVVLLSGGQLLLSAFGLWALLRTITQGRDANEIALNIGRLQTQAYVSFVSVEGQKAKGGLAFRVTVRNSGQSPALAAQIRLKVIDDTGLPKVIFPEEEHHIPANNTAEMAYCYFRNEDAVNWNGIVVLAEVGYADVFETLYKISERFAGTPKRWSYREFTALANGGHVANFLRAGMPE